MEDTPLTRKTCLPCSGQSEPLSNDDVARYHKHVPEWVVADRKLKKTFRFKNFVLLMEFANQMAALAEEEGHHPDFSVHYNILDVVIWTHAIDNLSESDFILAAKIDALKTIPTR